MKGKYYISVDLGSQTGWATFCKEDGVNSNVLNLREKGKFSPYGFWKFENWLEVQIACAVEDGFGTNNIVVLVEKPHCGKFMAAVRILFGLLAIVHKVCYDRQITLIEYSPKAIKKYWTGNGNADKKKMVARTQEFGYTDVTDHNESDALALLHLHLKGVK